MIKKLAVWILLLVTSYQLQVTPISAQEQAQFSANYDLTYDVIEDGMTQVTEEVTLKNLTERFYPANFSLLVSSTKISDQRAYDSGGNLELTTTPQGSRTKVDVSLNQTAGLNKEYKWTLQYKSTDFTQKQGRVWQVTIPKINSTEATDNYNVTLIVPVSFGDFTTMTPTPRSQSEIGGKLNYQFAKNQLQESGIFSSFGTNQQLNFTLKYNLKNDSYFSSTAKISLPPNTDFQDILLKNITPKPSQVVVDPEGNLIAFFTLGRKSSIQVEASGEARLKGKHSKSTTLPPELYKSLLSSQRFWDVDSPQIKGKLVDIFKDKNPKNSRDKAELINQYVASTLQFNGEKAKNSSLDRLGALTALNNTDQSIAVDFVDTFITLARSADIPARMLIGYAYSNNNDIRPLSYPGGLHVWPDYYDPAAGWMMIDPTWQQTAGGVDYFNSFDLNHLVLVVRGLSSEEPSAPDSAQVTFSEAEFKPSALVKASINVTPEIFAGFPNKLKIKFENTGSTLSKPISYQLAASHITMNGPINGTIPALPPFGFYEQTLNLTSTSLLDSYDDQIILDFGKEKITQNVKVKAFFTHQYFDLAVGGVVGAILLFYILTLVFHVKKQSRNKRK